MLTQLLVVLIGCLQILAQLLFVLAQLLFVLDQLLFLPDHLGYFFKLERWKLLVRLQELKQVISKANAVMRLMLYVVLIFEGMSEMEVERTVFQFETKT